VAISKFVILLLLLVMANMHVIAKDELTFSTPPTQTKKSTEELYRPIVEYIQKVSGKKIKLIIADNFIEYSQDLLDDKYDIVFDGPQFIGWRIKKRNHEVIAKLPRKLNFLIFVRKDAGIKKIRKLAGKRVCGIGSPNLMTLGLLDMYPNPASIPTIIPVTSFKAALACVHEGKAVAAVVRNKFWHTRSAKQKKGLKVLYEAKRNWPDRGFSISKSVDVKTRKKIRKALLSPAVKEKAGLLFEKYKAKHFIPAKRAEYAPLDKLLRPIWGFHKR